MTAEAWSTQRTIHVRLLGGEDMVLRPVPGEPVGRNRYRLLPMVNCNAFEEQWEFFPGSVVKCHKASSNGRRLLVAHTLA